MKKDEASLSQQVEYDSKIQEVNDEMEKLQKQYEKN